MDERNVEIGFLQALYVNVRRKRIFAKFIIPTSQIPMTDAGSCSARKNSAGEVSTADLSRLFLVAGPTTQPHRHRIMSAVGTSYLPRGCSSLKELLMIVGFRYLVVMM